MYSHGSKFKRCWRYTITTTHIHPATQFSSPEVTAVFSFLCSLPYVCSLHILHPFTVYLIKHSSTFKLGIYRNLSHFNSCTYYSLIKAFLSHPQSYNWVLLLNSLYWAGVWGQEMDTLVWKQCSLGGNRSSSRSNNRLISPRAKKTNRHFLSLHEDVTWSSLVCFLMKIGNFFRRLWYVAPPSAWTEPFSTVIAHCSPILVPDGGSHGLTESTQRCGGKGFRSGTAPPSSPPSPPSPPRLLAGHLGLIK